MKTPKTSTSNSPQPKATSNASAPISQTSESTTPAAEIWHPTDEQFPDADIQVLAHDVDGYMWIASYDDELGIWSEAHTSMQLLNITHWQDLPEPPTA